MTTNDSVVVYTPTEILEIIKNRFEKFTAHLNGQEFFVGIRGVLGTIPPSNYPYYYNVPLKDSMNAAVSLTIPKSIGDVKAYQQKEVIVYGLIKSKLYGNSLNIYIDATRIEPVVEMSQEVKEQETRITELVSSHLRGLRYFPDLETYNISVIHGISSQVKEDFERQIGQDPSINITYIPINITSSVSLKEVIESVKGDVVVVIRGGGSEGQFEVFNDFELVRAWIDKDAYKVSALGHTQHRTFFDLFASQSCDTPTDAGAFIRRSIDALKAVKKIDELSAQHKKQIEEIYNKHKKDIEETSKNHANKLEELQKAKETEVKALNEKASKEKDELNKKIEALNKEFAEKLEEIQKKKDAEVKELNEKIEQASKEKEEILKDKEIKVLSKEEEIKSLLSKLAVKDTQVKVSLAITILSIIGLIVALIKLL